MKPTSLIFLVLSVILLVGGFMTCGIAKSMAAKQGIAIYDQEIDEAGDSVYTYNISDDTISKLALTFSGVDVNIVGTKDKSYVELKNFDVNSYRTSLGSSAVTVDGTVSFFSSMIDMSGGGIQFRGLRYFLLDKPDPKRPKAVNIYISETSELKTLTLSLNKGNVTCKNLSNSLDYYLTVTNGNVTLDSIQTISVAELNVRGGNITVQSSEIATLNAVMDSGNFTVTANGAYSGDLTSYDLKTADGTVNVNTTNVGTDYKVTSAAQKCLIKVNILTKGNVTVNDGGTPPPAPTPEEG